MASLFEFLFGDCLYPRYDRPNVWTEADAQRYPQWLGDIIAYNEKLPHELHPAVKELKDVIEHNTSIKLLACGMCEELILRGNHQPMSARVNAIRSYEDLLTLFNYMLRVPPLWNTHMFTLGMEAAPFWLLLLEPMHTECGFAFFIDDQVNVVIKKIMNAWGAFLQSSASGSCLNESSLGWFGTEALQRLAAEGDVHNQNYTFDDMYIGDPSKPDRGYKTWDEFFTRRFRKGIRPIADPEDNSIVVNACESMPWRVARNVKYEDKFWAKGGAYSLKDMLECDELSTHFVGGTVYQAYLSAMAYHRWHSPVSGTIRRVDKIAGTYFSEPLNKGFGPDPSQTTNGTDPNWEQAYLTSTATRAVIYIDADNRDIGLMAVILIGMGEVSSCDVTVKQGQRIEKGDDLGLFHFGGSTHCVLFGPDVELSGLPDPQTAKKNMPVNGRLARATRRQRLPDAEKVGL